MSGENSIRLLPNFDASNPRHWQNHIRRQLQHAADGEFPFTDPANAPERAEFKLGIFPPDP
jgi:predicted alpha/beta hydrolase family esterase